MRSGATVALAVLMLTQLAMSAPPALAAGFGGSGSLNNLTEGTGEESETPATSTTATSTTASTSTSESSGKSSTVVTALIAVGVVLLGGVAFVIVRDARKWVPAGDVELAEGAAKRKSQVALEKRRAKAKAARRQRKRNR
jgi:hypothetical protein